MNFETISVIGLGYIGLPTAGVFASRKTNVIGVDVNQHAVDTINRGEIHIVEPELDVVIQGAVKAGYLQATTTPKSADAFLIAVPTPFLSDPIHGSHQADLSYIEAASKAIAPVLEKGNLVVLESTSPAGATEKMAQWLSEARPDLSFPQTHGEASDIRIAHCPERVLPGQVVRELVENDRVIGGMTAKCSEAAVNLYNIIVEGECVTTTARTAEMAKLTENAFRDVNIAFANELSIISDKLDINVWELIQLANRHPRVNILQPGAGVGGHCIAVDPWFIVDSCPEEAKLIGTARHVNDGKPDWVLSKIKAQLDELHQQHPEKSRSDFVVACMGIAFKPDIDDLRESPAMGIAQQVAQLGCKVQVIEPNIISLPKSLQLDNVELVGLDHAEKADIHAVLVKHHPFMAQAEFLLGQPRVIDAVGLTNALPTATLQVQASAEPVATA
ncbi:UDP-N-acetyl-D-mannosamine dehydrogenase [Salinivibrio kushneri]|uniref:UDP-N-acetyl-D-mannosamine dehydrogenase n=1 Tax=Salinivibrio kushneri TaxID=1908198 RepID=A0AB36JWH0_9GAMM|nr:UDP-N-acetyl-D-mannosamine dehydrogenase [Salinivibrio kushneri]OOE39344.1 UDP-N-acetyl-D-mannosamine dehydrogenase [Salinivibrio kushneri]QCP02422.1 UDP-N-acetyl-D-mannosamine dehydrogenase [Salinivibrio kushneri]